MPKLRQMSPSAFIWTSSGSSSQNQSLGYASAEHIGTSNQATFFHNGGGYTIPPDENHSHHSSSMSFGNDLSSGDGFSPPPQFREPLWHRPPIPPGSRIIELSDDDGDDDMPQLDSSLEHTPQTSPSPMGRSVTRDVDEPSPYLGATATLVMPRIPIPPYHLADGDYYDPRFPPAAGAADNPPQPPPPPPPPPPRPCGTSTASHLARKEEYGDYNEDYDDELALQAIHDHCLVSTKRYLTLADTAASAPSCRHHRRRYRPRHHRRNHPYRRRRDTAIPAATPSLRENAWRIADLFWRRARRAGPGAARGVDADAATRMATLLHAADAVVFGGDVVRVAADAAVLCTALDDEEGSRSVWEVAVRRGDDAGSKPEYVDDGDDDDNNDDDWPYGFDDGEV